MPVLFNNITYCTVWFLYGAWKMLFTMTQQVTANNNILRFLTGLEIWNPSNWENDNTTKSSRIRWIVFSFACDSDEQNYWTGSCLFLSSVKTCLDWAKSVTLYLYKKKTTVHFFYSRVGKDKTIQLHFTKNMARTIPVFYGSPYAMPHSAQTPHVATNTCSDPQPWPWNSQQAERQYRQAHRKSYHLLVMFRNEWDTLYTT